MDNKTEIYSKNAIEFITVGREFLAFCNSKTKGGRDGFAQTSLKLLSLLYLKALTVPDIESESQEEIEKYVSEENWALIKHNVENKLDDWDDIVKLQDASMMNSTDFINVSLSELFADIYQDVGDLIGAYQLGNETTMHNALFTCMSNFKSYWGMRLIKIQETLHQKIMIESENEE